MKSYKIIDDPNGVILINDNEGKLNRKVSLIEIDAQGLPIKPLEQIKKKNNISFDEKEREAKQVKVDTSLNPFEWIKAKLYHIKREGEFKMFEAIKKFIIPKIVQWLMKVAGSILAYLGISSGTIEEIVSGVVIFVLSAIWSLISTGKIALTDPKDFLKLK